MRAEEFLQIYRMLEETLGEKYNGTAMRHSSVVSEYLSDPESEPVRDKLDMLREMRNLLSHNADLDGQMVFEPSEGVLRTLNAILDYVRRPPLALSLATPAERLLCAGPHDHALPLMRVMQSRGFSHVPVMESGCVIGVFSTRTVFTRMVRDPDFDIRSGATLDVFRDLLPTDAHRGETYLFLPQDATVIEARRAFDRCPAPNRRLAAIFITDTGNPRRPLLGMLTPWDVMTERSERK